MQPKPEDPSDYVAVQVKSGRRFAITTSCAANVLGLAKPEWYSHGNAAAARIAIGVLAQHLGLSPEDTARRILDVATDKIIPVITDLIIEYQLDRDQVILAEARRPLSRTPPIGCSWTSGFPRTPRSCPPSVSLSPWYGTWWSAWL